MGILIFLMISATKRYLKIDLFNSFIITERKTFNILNIDKKFYFILEIKMSPKIYNFTIWKKELKIDFQKSYALYLQPHDFSFPLLYALSSFLYSLLL